MNTLPLFDANGCFGCTVNAAPAYPRARDLLAHLDRLGVERSVVWHVAAGMHHLPSVNRTLLKEIDATPGAAGRLIPALAVSSTMFYEPGAMRALRTMMTARGIRALRYKSSFNHTLRQLEPLLQQLRALKPVVFFQMSETHPEEVLAVAQALPDVTLVITQVMWPGYVVAYDLMRRCPNILLENSWMHTWNAIEITVREFGAERLLFGMGDRSHNGASIAALVDADITPAQRALIAHGNLERVLGLAPAKALRPKRPASTLWAKLLAGRKPGVPIIDAHYHLGASGGYVLETHDIGEQIKATLQKADQLGVATILVSSLDALLGDDPLAGNRDLAKALKPYGGRIRPYFGFNPRFADALAPALPRMMGSFVGFKTLCDYWAVPITDTRFTPMWKYADAHRLPILNHTWDGRWDSPAMLKEVVKEYPHAIFLLGHSGGGDAGRAEAEELAAGNDNVYLEWCGSFCSSVPWEKTLAKVGSDKVVYGSDAYAHGMAWELGRLLSLDLPDQGIRPILGANMRRILAMRC